MTPPTSTLNSTPKGRGKAGSMWGLAALLVSLVSFGGLIAVRIGDTANWSGFSERDPHNDLAYFVWDLFAIGVLIAPVLGVLAVWRGSRRNRRLDVTLGSIAIVWSAIAIFAMTAASS